MPPVQAPPAPPAPAPLVQVPLVPPPRFHVVKYHGIFAGHARGRHALTGRGCMTIRRHAHGALHRELQRQARQRRRRPRPLDTTYLAGPDAPERDRRLPWAELFKRVFREDVLVCRRCGGEMRVVAAIFGPAVAERILRHVGLWERGPPPGRYVAVARADHESLYA